MRRTIRIEGLTPGAYELRVRAVNLDGSAQPEPRPNRQSGNAGVPCLTILVTEIRGPGVKAEHQ